MCRYLLVWLALVVFALPTFAQQRLRVVDNAIATVVNGNNEFAFALYQRIAKTEGNLFFSPYSISGALAIAYAGARGNTAAEMKKTLRFNLAAERFHPAFGKLMTDLHGQGKTRDYDLRVANRLWGQRNFGFAPDFVKLCGDEYQGGFEEVDFRKSETAREQINGWVAHQTNNKITDLFARGQLDPDSALVLTNAIYFNASWAQPFDGKLTKPEPFLLANGQKIETPMMQRARMPRMHLVVHKSYAVAELPYLHYEQSMVIVLPAKDVSLADVEKELTTANLAAWRRPQLLQEISVKLPKFKLMRQVKADTMLKQMGMKDAFQANVADFSGMASGAKLVVSTIVHKAFIDVNEVGTQAAAATGAGFRNVSYSEPLRFHVDRPFLFLIRDNPTGSILFMGRVVNPKS